MPLYGGNRNGRAREDGLVPGSAQAVEADKKKDRERKQKQREAIKRVALPPALPSASQVQVDSTAAPLNGAELALGAPAGPAEVPWEPDVIEPLFVEVLDFLEKRQVQKVKEAATEAQLGQALTREIAEDAQYPAAFKISAAKHGPRAICNTLNRLGLSAKYSDEGIFVFSVLGIGFYSWRLQSKLQELIEESKAARAAQAAAAKPKETPK